MDIPTPLEDNQEWILVFRQTLSDASPQGWTQDLLSMNSDDPSAANYAILDKLEKFRNPSDNKFEFKLFWPNNPDLKYQHWKQTTNPTDETSTGNVEGYEAIKINHNVNGWGGLEYTGLGPHKSLMSGSVRFPSIWWYSLGTYNLFKGGRACMRGGMPGPNISVNKVELWVKAPLIQPTVLRKLEAEMQAQLSEKNQVIEKQQRMLNEREGIPRLLQ